MSDHTARCWGNNNYGELGDGTLFGRTLPVVVQNSSGTGPLSDIRQISIGDGEQTCAAMGTGQAECWGENDWGQIGTGNATGPQSCTFGVPCSKFPSAVVGMSGTGMLANVIQVGVGFESVCARLTDLTLRCWGHNESGELGDASTLNSLLPMGVRDIDGLSPLTGVSLSTGNYQSCVLRSDHTARCWGSDLYAQLADNSIQNEYFAAVVGDGGNVVIGTPNPPGSASAAPGDHLAHVSWAPPSDNGSAITGYTVTASPGGATVGVAAPTTATDVTGLTAGLSYTFTVHATNAIGDSLESDASNAIVPFGLPLANAGPDASVDSGAHLVLDATGSSDPNHLPVTFHWDQIGGPLAVIDDTSKSRPHVTAPKGPATLTFQVTVTNSGGTSSADSVVITVKAPK